MTSKEIREIATMCSAIIVATLRATAAEARHAPNMEVNLRDAVNAAINEAILAIAEDVGDR
jgi:hypothetical protein